MTAVEDDLLRSRESRSQSPARREVRASYNDSSKDAHLQVVLAPAMGDGGYELVDVSGDAPRATLRG